MTKIAESSEALEFLDKINTELAAAGKQAEAGTASLGRLPRSGSGNFLLGLGDYLRVQKLRSAEAARRDCLYWNKSEIADACAKFFAVKNSAWPRRREEIGDEIARIVRCQALGKPSPSESRQLEERLMALEGELEAGDRQASDASNVIETFLAARPSEIETCFSRLCSFARDLSEAA
jgi:hypothetical protein